MTPKQMARLLDAGRNALLRYPRPYAMIVRGTRRGRVESIEYTKAPIEPPFTRLFFSLDPHTPVELLVSTSADRGTWPQGVASLGVLVRDLESRTLETPPISVGYTPGFLPGHDRIPPQGCHLHYEFGQWVPSPTTPKLAHYERPAYPHSTLILQVGAKHSPELRVMYGYFYQGTTWRVTDSDLCFFCRTEDPLNPMSELYWRVTAEELLRSQ